MKISLAALSLAVPALLSLSGTAQADVLFANNSDNGFFVPFNPGNAETVKYGDSGWLGSFNDGAGTYTLNQITLRLAIIATEGAGSTDVVFTLNDGDPSGLVFGPGTQLYSVTIPCVQLPANSQPQNPIYFDLTIPLPGIQTTGGFNNVGWSVALDNYDYAGQFGFQVSTASGQTNGFYTNNASFHDGTSWSLFAFGPDSNIGVANFAAVIRSDPFCFADLANGFGDPTPDGGVDVNDLLFFLGAFEAGANAADLDNGSGTGVRDCGVDVNDLLFFLARFEAGC